MNDHSLWYACMSVIWRDEERIILQQPNYSISLKQVQSSKIRHWGRIAKTRRLNCRLGNKLVAKRLIIINDHGASTLTLIVTAKANPQERIFASGRSTSNRHISSQFIRSIGLSRRDFRVHHSLHCSLCRQRLARSDLRRARQNTNDTTCRIEGLGIQDPARGNFGLALAALHRDTTRILIEVEIDEAFGHVGVILQEKITSVGGSCGCIL